MRPLNIGEYLKPLRNVSCTFSEVWAIQQLLCCVILKGSVYEKPTTSSSPFCSMSLLKSMVLPSILTGVPVFSLLASKPISFSCSVIPWLATSPILPPGKCCSPMWIRPLRKVPLVRMTALLSISPPIMVFTPLTWSPSTMSPTTVSCQKSRLGVFSNRLRHSAENIILSLWQRGLHMAGPFDLLSIRN